MRITVTLDADVERFLRTTMKERRISFNEALNHAIRAGARGAPQGTTRCFMQETFAMGGKQEFRWEKALAAADAMEEEDLIQKL